MTSRILGRCLLQFVYVSQQHDCRSTPSILNILAPRNFLFPEFEMALKGRSSTDNTMTQAKSREALAEFQTVRIMKYFERWRDRWSRCRMSNGN